jgi:monomeric sarcosine oxidase
MASWDCIVLGAGGVGSSALFHLAKRGLHVLGIDRFAPGHDRGSSHGQTRLIRLAYFEHPDYVPLLKRAYELWEELEHCGGMKLYHEIGILEIGPRGGEVVSGVLASARQHQLEVETLDGPEIERRFPGFRIPEPYVGVLEKRAGYLEVENCVRAHAAEAAIRGAQLNVGETVLGWKTNAERVEVQTDRAVHQSAALIVTPGAWSPAMLPALGVPLQVLRKPMYWYEPDTNDYRVDRGFPGFIFETTDGVFYGFPQVDEQGVKVAEHTGGHIVGDPLSVNRTEDPDETRRLSDFLDRFMPGLSLRLRRFGVCLYTMSPDQHFIVDFACESPRVAFAAGLSGHGFKFTSVLGELLADLIVEGRSRLPWEFLRKRSPAAKPLDRG